MENKLSKKLLMIAIPVAIQNLINVGVSVTDTLMIGNISEVQLSGVSQANQVYFIFTTLIFGLASGSTVLTSQYWGEKKVKPIREILGLMVRIGIICGILLGILVISMPKEVMAVFTNNPEVIAYGAEYLKIIGYSYVLSAFTGVFLMGLRSLAKVKVSIYVYGISFILNVFLNWVLIYGKFGFPAMEIRGAAIATLISRVVEVLLTLIYMYFIEKELSFRLKDILRKTNKYWRRLSRYSIPVLFSEIHWGLGISVQAAIIGRLGLSVLAASSFINVFQQLAGVIVMGIGAASGILTGIFIGEGKEEEALRASKIFMVISAVIGAGTALIAVLFRPIAPDFINASSETAQVIRDMLWVSAYLLFFQCLNVTTLAGILRGSGDTVFCAALDVGTLWILKVGCGLLFTLIIKVPPVWVYFILSSDEFIKALITTPRVMRGKWIHRTTG